MNFTVEITPAAMVHVALIKQAAPGWPNKQCSIDITVEEENNQGGQTNAKL